MKSIIFFSFLLFSGNSIAQKNLNLKNILNQEYSLIPQHSHDTQYYKMETRLIKYGLDGTRQGTDTYRLLLRCVPASETSKADEYTCLKFSVQLLNAQEVTIPSLIGWKYLFSINGDTKNSKDYLFGIDHSKFEILTDEDGKVVLPDNSYHIYNAFIDFHTMNIFSEKSSTGKAVQDLKYIGDTVTHSASYSQPPVNLGSQVAQGSYFKNGKITLEFKGLSIVNKKNCCLLGYDSGESNFFMIIKPMANMEVTTKGTSHYRGDIYKDLTSGWIQRANLQELVISETTVPGIPNKITSIIERNIEIENIKHPFQ